MADLEEEKGKSESSTGRVIWVDPNMSNNTMVNPEDLCIKVDFSATRKDRSIIYSGKESINTIGNSGSVRFIEGSKVNEESTQPSLTTRYTEVIALDIMNMGNTQSFDDYESLGIESIDIEFNTAYAPMIKIKFIDVRGNAILSQGNMSKYRMFFELPYPIFSLKVKGFYGKTVNYCLHMQRWNAAFNSDTGNFEIQAEFIGYTYALLTDMLMGLIRASVRTKRGQKKLAEKQAAYGDNSNLIISIDDMLKRLNELNFSYQKTNENDDSVQQVNAYDGISDDIANVKGLIDTASTTIYDGQNPPNNYFRSPTGSVVGVPNNADNVKKADDAIKTYKESITNTLLTINPNIIDNTLKLSEDTLNAVITITDIKYSEINNEDINNCVPFIIQKSAGKYSDNEEDTKKIIILLKEIRSAITTPIDNNASMNIYSFLRPYYHIDEKSAALKTNRDNTVQRIGEQAANQAEETVGFEPTIRNIFRVLSVNCEIFLEVLREVSVEAQTDADGKRAVEFNKISGKINVNQKEIQSNNIFPWPEYRQKKGTEGYEETWLGSAPGIIPMNIQEVVFTEELHKELLNVAKFDKELDAEQAEQGADIDSLPEQIKDPWFPISVVDTPPSGMEQNPYIAACETGKSDEVLRLLLMRGFLLLGVSAYNSKIDLDLVKVYGRLEAANLYEASKKTENGLNIIKELQNLGGNTDPVKQTDHVLYFNGLQGKDTIKNPGIDEGKKKPIMQKIGNDYRYVYITNSEWDGEKFTKTVDSRAYIPVNNNYDGTKFYYKGKLKSQEYIKKLSSTTIFVNNPKNLFAYDGLYNNDFFIYLKDDGSHLLKIIDKGTYQAKAMTPGFGGNTIEEYKTKFAGKFLNVTNFKNAYISNPNNRQDILKGLDPLSSTYSALEINYLDYNGETPGTPSQWVGESYTFVDNKIATSLTSFYTQNVVEIEWPVGTYLTYKPDESYFKTKIPKEPKNNETYIVPSWASQVYITGFGAGENSKREHRGYGKQKTLTEKFLSGSSKPYVPFIEFGYDEYYTFSLFGSALYNNQWSTKAKALLFLHCFPWQGVLAPGDDVSEFAMFDTRSEAPSIGTSTPETSDKPTRIKSIKSMFKVNGAFVQVPKAWALLMGAMLWRRRYRLTEGGDPINWVEKKSNGTYKSLIGGYSGDYPSTRQFLYYSEDNFEPWGMYFNDSPSGVYENQQNIYTPIDKTIAGLPRAVKNEFIDYFEKWVNDETTGFKYFQKELEIWYGRDSNKPDPQKEFDYYQAKWAKLEALRLAGAPSNDPDNDSEINTTKVKEIFNDNSNLFNNYVMITSVYDGSFTQQGGNFQIQLELRPDTEVMNNIVGLLTEGVYIQNVRPYTWIPNDDTPASLEKNKDYYQPIDADGYLFNVFLENFFTEINSTDSNAKTEDDQIEQEVFGTSDDKTIRLLIYRTLSSINDKWINGTSDNSIFGQCSGSNKNPKDVALGAKYRSGATTAELIDTFRFVDRAFWDIGDKFYLNINAISDVIKSNYNQSFFDVVNKILTDNNFNFIPLPTFVNFNNVNELKTVFSAYSYNDVVGFSGTGPSFVCVFVGQSSTNLDLGPESVYPDDGLSISMDESGAGLDLIDEKEDFAKEVEVGEFNVPVFAVNYGQQNQNYFKSIKLDQREFTETMESLQIIEDISQSGDKSKPTYAGNNLFNVYQTRSYSAEVEMLGSAMIQPMMYFQLNNIPMFRGAYLIYKVNHSIKPHSMTTTIKGNRVKKSKTPLIDKYTMYMNLVGGGSGGGTAGIREGGGSGGYNATPGAKFIDTNIEFYWLTQDGKIPTGKDTLGLTNSNKQFTGMKKQSGARTYALREVVEVLQKVSLEFYKKYKDNSSAPDTVYYNDASKLWGGTLSPHKSHTKGIDIDVRQLFYGKSTAAGANCSDNGSSNYSKKYTKEWVTGLLKTPFRKYTLVGDKEIKYTSMDGSVKTAKKGDTISDQRAIEIIWFNDTSLQSELNSEFNPSPGYNKIMATLEGHCNHLHVRFNTPLRVTEETEKGENSRPATQGNPDDTGSVSISGDNAKDGLIYLIKEKGYPSYKAIGAIAAIMGESGTKLNPKAINNSSGAYGIAQWLGGRLASLKSKSNYDTFETQIKYLYTELDPNDSNVDSIAKPFIEKAKNAEEMLAAMATFERWSYPVCLAKGCEYACKKDCGDGKVSYGRAYDKLVKEAKAKKSPDKSFNDRINYLVSVQKLHDELKKSGKL